MHKQICSDVNLEYRRYTCVGGSGGMKLSKAPVYRHNLSIQYTHAHRIWAIHHILPLELMK